MNEDERCAIFPHHLPTAAHELSSLSSVFHGCIRVVHAHGIYKHECWLFLTEHFVKSRRVTYLGTSTRRSGLWTFYLKPTFGENRIDAIERKQVKSLLAELAGKGLSHGTMAPFSR